MWNLTACPQSVPETPSEPLLLALKVRSKLDAPAGQYVETNMLCSTGHAMSRHLVLVNGSGYWCLPDLGQHGTSALCRLYRCDE